MHSMRRDVKAGVGRFALCPVCPLMNVYESGNPEGRSDTEGKSTQPLAATFEVSPPVKLRSARFTSCVESGACLSKS